MKWMLHGMSELFLQLVRMQVKYKALDSTWFKWKLPHCNTLIVESLNGNVNGNEEMVVSQIFVTIYDNMAMGQRYVIVL